MRQWRRRGWGWLQASSVPAPPAPDVSHFLLFSPWQISEVPLSQEAGACTSSPLTWGPCVTHPPEKVDSQEDLERGGCLPFSLSLSYEHCFSFNWFHSWQPFAKCNYARLSPSVCVQKEPSLSLFLSSIFISALIPTLQLTCTTMSRTS